MVKKIIFTILLVSSLSLLVACDKENKNVESGNGANKEVEAQETKGIAYEFYISEEGVYCTKAEWDEFYKIINDSFGDKIERIWLNGWHNESGVQGVTVDDDVIYNLWGMVDRKAYISNSCEDIIADFEAGEKVVLIGKDLVTDETTYTIGGEEYEIVGIFREGPMAEHMAVPVASYPDLDTVNVFLIYFTESLTDAEVEIINEAVEKCFDGKVCMEAVK